MASLGPCRPAITALQTRQTSADVMLTCHRAAAHLQLSAARAAPSGPLSFSARVGGAPLTNHRAPRGSSWETTRLTPAHPAASPSPARPLPHLRPLASSPQGTDSVQGEQKQEGSTSAASPDAAAPKGNGAAKAAEGAEAGAGAGAGGDLPLGDPELAPLQGLGKFGAQVKMLLAPPWARVKKGSVLTLRLSGRVSEQLGGFGSGSSLSLPKLLENLEKAALDPRVSALAVRIEGLAVGWGKVDEIRRYVQLFRKSGKPTIAYMQVVGEMDYYLASAFQEIYVPPSAYVSLRGLAVQGAFLGGVLEKAGVQPQVVRIGKYKSAGDQFQRKDMSEAQREVLSALLDDIYFNWISAISAARGKTVDEIQELLDSGVIKAEQLLESGLVNGLMYERELEIMLKERLGQTDPDKPLRRVEYRKYGRVGKGTFGLKGSKDAAVAVLRASGAISQGRDRGMSGSVRSDSFIDKIRFVRDAKQFKAVVLRIDSPGGDALASDLMWHELRELAKVKPLVASMSDVAASGGYYMAMAADSIVAEHLTLTGSIGVVLAKFNLGNLYGRIGFNREILSRGKYAELNADNRPFTPEEEEFFEKGAQSAYESFRNKAAMSRGMEVEAMEAVAQGRVWTGNQARQRGLVDAVGGISRAIAIAKERAGIPADKRVRTVELSVASPSLTAVLSGATVLAQVLGVQGEVAQRQALAQILVGSMGGLDQETSMLMGSPPGTPHAMMEDIQVMGISQLSQSGAGLGAGLESGLFGSEVSQGLPFLRGLLPQGE